MVGLRNSGAVSRMKSFQNWPGTSGSSGGGARRIVASSKPLASSVPANDSSTTNTTRCPRSRSTVPMPTQLFVGPNAPSGKNTTVFGSVTLASTGPFARTVYGDGPGARNRRPARSILYANAQAPLTFLYGPLPRVGMSESVRNDEGRRRR